jgi:hypothetical protein
MRTDQAQGGLNALKRATDAIASPQAINDRMIPITVINRRDKQSPDCRRVHRFSRSAMEAVQHEAQDQANYEIYSSY